VECFTSEPELLEHVYGHLYNMSWVESLHQLKALKGPGKPLESHSYAHHGSTGFRSVYFRSTQWLGQAAGEDQRFNRGILVFDRHLGQDTGYFAAWRMLWYYESRTARFDKSRNHPI
jgi:hypothetical protein